MTVVHHLDVARLKALAGYYSDLTQDFSWYENVIAYWLNTNSVRDVNLYNFGPDTCKGRRQKLVHPKRIIYH